jgi:predicted nucleic-acid-binding Zn-ribbon protein
MNILNIDTVLNPCFGGHVGTIIKSLRNKEFKCSKCGHTFTIKEFRGQAAGDEGFFDKYGKRWFVIVECPNCKRSWSAYELMNRLITQ